MALIAPVCGLSAPALDRWCERRSRPTAASGGGRPPKLGPAARDQIRQQYVASYGQWGPRVLACWAERQGLGKHSPTTIGRAIADLRPEPPAKKPALSYEVAGPGVMWSEDGAGFREAGRKRELLLVGDECSRLKVGHELVDGPATGADVRAVLKRAFDRHGAPLVLKRDGGSIFDEHGVRELLDEYGVVALTSPPRTPRYNGRAERAFRDVRSHERAQREHGVGGTLDERIDRSIDDLNEHRPRPVLGGRTAREVHEATETPPVDREAFRREVDRREQQLRSDAIDRHQRDAARRLAIEDVLCRHGLITWKGDVSPERHARIRTT